MARKRRRHAEPAPIGALLRRWLSRQGMEAELVQYTIWVRWPELVGDRLAAHTEPGALRNGQLMVKVSSASWLNELSFMREELVQRINSGLGEQRVREVRLLAGLVRKRHRVSAALQPEPPAAGTERLPGPLLAEAELAAAAVGDPELREVVRRAGVARIRGRDGG